MKQSFLENGNLTPGIHEYSLQNLKEQFVESFILSETRERIFEEFTDWIKSVITICPPQAIWIDGSFVTTKTDPNDIDIVLLYSPRDFQNEEQAENLHLLLNKGSSNKCGAYFCYTLSGMTKSEQANYSGDFHIMEHYWKGFFSFDRNRNPKGIVEIIRKELLEVK